MSAGLQTDEGNDSDCVDTPRERSVQSIGSISHPAASLDGECRLEVHSLGQLSADVECDWDELASEASTPNVFYERWNAQAAAHLRPNDDVQLVLIYRRGRQPNSPSRLCGLFPLVRERLGAPRVTTWSLWGHPYVYLRTPLLRCGQERASLEALLDWMDAEKKGPRIINWPLVDGEGPFAQALTEVVSERGLVHVSAERYTRAMLHRQSDWERAAATELSSHHRRELRRLHRRLCDQGQLTLRKCGGREDLRYWREMFLHLEQSGWKGAKGTAVATDSASRQYFDLLTERAAATGRLQMLGLFLDGEPIALKVNLHAGRGSFAFKIAYDERFAKFSPGVQLEVENIRVLHEESKLQWMDSCAVANHFMINRLWTGRRVIDRNLISLGGSRSNLLVGAVPLRNAVRRSLRRGK